MITRLAFLIFVLAARRPRTLDNGPHGWRAEAWKQYGRMGELS